MVRAWARPLLLLPALLLFAASAFTQARGPAAYYPDADWRHKTPAQAGLDAARLKGAIDFAIASESRSPRDLALNHYPTFGPEPFGDAIGPTKGSGAITGAAVTKGYIAT